MGHSGLGRLGGSRLRGDQVMSDRSSRVHNGGVRHVLKRVLQRGHSGKGPGVCRGWRGQGAGLTGRNSMERYLLSTWLST